MRKMKGDGGGHFEVSSFLLTCLLAVCCCVWALGDDAFIWWEFDAFNMISLRRSCLRKPERSVSRISPTAVVGTRGEPNMLP